MQITKSTVASLDSASCEAKTVLDYQTPSAPQLLLSREAKAKAPSAYSEAAAALLASIILMGSVKPATCEAKIRIPVRANNVADLVSLSLLSTKKLYYEARGKALLGANSEALLISLAGKALHNRAKFASKSRTKAVTSPCEATSLGEAILASSIAKRKAFKVRPAQHG